MSSLRMTAVSATLGSFPWRSSAGKRRGTPDLIAPRLVLTCRGLGGLRDAATDAAHAFHGAACPSPGGQAAKQRLADGSIGPIQACAPEPEGGARTDSFDGIESFNALLSAWSF